MSKNINKNIVFHGFLDRNQIAKVLKRSHVFCMPSTSEAFTTTLMEAMTFGCVPIFTKGDSLPHVYNHGECGLKIPTNYDGSHYSVDYMDIVKSINILIDNKNYWQELSKNSWKYANDTFSNIKSATKKVELYKEILD